ncbi:MAG: DNA-directed RNA polymerase subunit delta, partial [Sphingobacteriales bacterium]
IDAVREIDEKINRRHNSRQSYTFHGRDVYAYTAAKLAAGKISFEEVGRLLPDSVVAWPFQRPLIVKDTILGNIPVLDPQFGNIWTNIPDSLFKKLSLKAGEEVEVEITNNKVPLFAGRMKLVNTFGEVPRGTALAYMNSLMNFSLALNEANFADSFKIGSGPEWNIRVSRCCKFNTFAPRP